MKCVRSNPRWRQSWHSLFRVLALGWPVITGGFAKTSVFKKVRFVCYAFQQIKALLTNAPMLAAPNFEPFKLAIDASELGVGAVQLKDGADGGEHPMSYFSKKFKCHQRMYAAIEKEALAMILALNHFEVYVGPSNVPMVIYTDHNPLFLKKMRNTNQRLMRWSIFMQAFNVTVTHIHGRECRGRCIVALVMLLVIVLGGFCVGGKKKNH